LGAIDIRKAEEHRFHILKLEMSAGVVAAWDWVTTFAVCGSLKGAAEAL